MANAPSNWTSPHASCAKYNDLRKPVLTNIGVKIDASEPWADEFRRALNFWNTVLPANFHEVTDLHTCSIRIINGGPRLLKHAVIARSQFTERANFRGKIAVSPTGAKRMDSAQIFRTAVHELGHMLGLTHSASINSVMYPIDLDWAEFLDSHDIEELSSHHQLQGAVLVKAFVRVEPVPNRVTSNEALEITLLSARSRLEPPAKHH